MRDNKRRKPTSDVGEKKKEKAAFDAATNNKVKKQMSDGIGRKRRKKL